MTTSPTPDWPALLKTWDQQQSGYLRHREHRFNVVLDALSTMEPAPTRILDLGCGPGSFAARLIDRFDTAHVVALDNDPVLLHVGRAALGDGDGRLSFVDADLRTTGWETQWEEHGFDAVVSSTALHWLGPAQLASVYQALGRITRTGGRFFNADNLAYDRQLPTFTALAAEAINRHTADAFADSGTPDWDTWWADVLALPELNDARVERTRRAARRQSEVGDHSPLTRLTSEVMHTAALREAGFREVGTIWQDHDDRVLLGIR